MKVIILVGGSGKRLWPLSREYFPKQFIKFDDKSFFQKTFLRAKKFSDEVLIVTNEKLKFLVLRDIEELGFDFPEENILIEPMAKNTLPAIVLGMKYVDDEALIFPADHLIKGDLVETVQNALKDSKEFLITFGIKPTSAHTGYGYIKHKDGMVLEFKEKPDKELAEEYVKKGYLWNSGIFLFNKKVFVSEMIKANPDLKGVFEVKNAKELYDKLPKISIDYGLMEKSSKIKVFPLDIKWNDLGSFDAIYDESEKDENLNVVKKKVIFEDAKRNLVFSDKVVAILGLSDVIVVDTKDALLVCKRGSDVKKIVKKLDGDVLKFHKTVYRPWGSFTVLEDNERFKVKRITVLPGKILSLQRHKHRDENWVVVKGKASVVKGEDNIVLKVGESVFIPRNVKHRIGNSESEILEVIETQTGDYFGEDDIIRLDDEYGRKD